MEEDKVALLGVYGATNFLGVQPLPRQLFENHLRLTKERELLKIVADQHGLTSTADIREALFAVDTLLAKSGREKFWGTYHFAGTG